MLLFQYTPNTECLWPMTWHEAESTEQRDGPSPEILRDSIEETEICISLFNKQLGGIVGLVTV